MKSLVFLLAVLFLGMVNSQQRQRPSSLSRGQRYPNEDENKACGQIRDVIPRNSGRFRKIIVRNDDNNAQYETNDCRLMTQRTKSKLDILASLVKRQWRSISVRVLRAWTDQVNQNNPLSLHYEGRSVRLRTSDGHRGKLEKLSGLALEAGFDWVEYTDYNYIRASVIPDVCQTSVDLAFLLDGSGSVGGGNFQKEKDFVKKVVDFFNIGRTGTHIAVVQYSTTTKTEFNLVRYYTKSDMKAAVDRIPYQNGWTYTAEALVHLQKYIFTPSAGMRTDAGIPKVLVLLTDGHSQGASVGPPAEELKKIGVSIFGIGVGSGISIQQLNTIASDPDSDYVYQRTFDNLIAGWVDRLSAVSCSEGSLIDACEESETSVDSGSFKYFRTQFQFVTGNQVSVELRDKSGVSHLYASRTSKNPGPLDSASVKNEDDTSPKAVSVQVDHTKTVFVAVQGQRDNNVFTLSFWDNLFKQPTYTVDVRENLNARLITTLSMSTNSGNFEYTITDGNNGREFSIDSREPRLRTTKSLDRERVPKYSLVIVAQSLSNKCHKSRTNVIVMVTDENDNDPKFTENPYRARISETTSNGAVVKVVKATDRDSGSNGAITYSITSQTPENRFEINQQGYITLKGTVDYERYDSYTVDLRARDGGGKTDDSQLEVAITNVNERPSIECNNTNCKYSVNENVQRGTGFNAKVSGTDPDTKTTCTLQYSLPSSVRNKFSVHATSGVISTSGELDREKKPSYRFPVTVRDCGGLTASVDVTVTVKDLNDNNPVFPGAYTVSILESEQPGSNVVQVRATDADEGNNAKITYTMTGSDSADFTINSVNGKITTRKNLDYEKKTSYNFGVVATDGGGLTGSQTVTVNVIDVNDNKPIFGGPYNKRISEGAGIGAQVITVKATDEDSGERGDIRYSIYAGNFGNAFAINAGTGLITVKSKLDRETRDSYKLTIQASDRGSPSLYARAFVAITVEDINDNYPVFQGTPYRKSIPEDFSTTRDILKVAATDKDAGNNGKITYSISGNSPQSAKETFSIDSSSGNIRLRKALDYERTQKYTFTVVATDGGGKAATENVEIFVEDVNDNTPAFQGNPYSANVAENVIIGHQVGTVQATDADSGPRGRISYSIVSGAENAFRVNAAGTVTIASSLDRETTAAYTLTIRARDDGQPSRSSTAKFTITITDINDNKPKFGKSSYSFTIAENNRVNDLVGKPGPATDLDAGKNAQIVYSIVSAGDDHTAFEFKSNGDLIAKEVLDREKKGSYSIEIVAKDQGQPSLSTKVPVKVFVSDKNDNSPTFEKRPYDCSIDENSASDSRVCFVRATDEDIGNNGKVVYELVSSSNEFSVSRDNGEIKTKISLDREKKSLYTFDVRAKDLGNPSRQSVVTITVNVLDKNDNEPEFDKDQYSFQIKEDASVKDGVGAVTASDKDEGQNGKVVYSIIGGNTKSAFSINPNTGAISVSSGLDRETLANYKLTIRASDRGTPPLSSKKNVPIKILDVNDNFPIFTSRSYSGLISEDAAVGSRVVQVKATDKDEGVNSQIKYNITAGVDKEHFTIHEDTGLITTAAKLDYETKTSYQLTVTATDQGKPQQSSTSQVIINVKNTNDNAPTFVPGSPIVHVSEAVAIGTKVVKFNATDEDGNKLTFSISKGNTNDALVLDKDTGLLTTKTKLDREKVARYNLTVTVTELTTNQRTAQSSSQNLSVIVTDENDNMPIFDPEQYNMTVNENEPAGVLVTVSATDLDEGKNAEISYTLDSNSAAKFTIDTKTGTISTKAPLDHEESSSYDITVTARDGGTPSLSATATVKVTVNDLNDNKPSFAQDYTTTLRENTAKGKTVLRVEASDPDSGANGNIAYVIRSGNNLGFFSLDKTSGVISVGKPPDREKNSHFTLSVEATNKPAFTASAPAAKTTCSVSITIEDANDNAPVITTNASGTVPENSPAVEVLDVDATDEDAGNNGEIEYKFLGGNVNNAFTIDSDSGVISTRGALDRETISRYTLTVQASDKGSPSLSSRKDFVVQVSDLDDNPPVFNPDSYDVLVPESASLNTSVVQLKATDKDIGKNAEISYSIASGNDQDNFRIDSDSGIIYTKAHLDYETRTQYNLVVEAKDTKHKSEANVDVRVENVNDNSPVFGKKVYKISIPENQRLDEKVLTVSATDKDPFGGLTYTFVPQNNMFTVDPSSGDISPVSELDRETTDYYNLTVQVTDGGSPGLSDTAVVEISITDINDNRPKFNSSSEAISVLENSPVGTVLLTVAATDADIGVNAKLRYTIKQGNEKAKFKLDANSGLLTVLENIDREDVDSFRLEIVAEDQGSLKLESTPLVVDVTVLDENDNDPVFTKSRYEQNITENLSAGIFVKDVEAIDADIGANGQVAYAILSGDGGYFRIESETGIVKTTKPLDREDIASFHITIIAKDQGKPSRNSTAVLVVNLLDANDNSPRLDTIMANVTEEQPKGQYVTRVVAMDSDQGRNGEVEYNLTIRGLRSLNIDPKTGVITTKVKFDYEEQRIHTFIVIATDKGNPSLSTTANLIINVIDIDDNCPVFNPKEYNVTIQENLPHRTDIVQVNATDPDTVGGDLQYGIRDGNIANTFIIGPTSGMLQAGRRVDREVAAEFNLIVRAGNDYCGVNITSIDDETIDSELSKSIANVNIFLTDLNDNPPMFLQNPYEYELTDMYTRNLLWLNATDPDEGLNAEFEFALHGASRKGAEYEVVITATDKGTPTMTSNTTLHVTGLPCEAMQFYVSARGQVTADTLCRFDKVQIPADAFVEERATFNCSAQGNTVAEYRWYRNGIPITDWLKNGEYVIKSLTKNDEGEYSCVASSKAGNILSKKEKFVVKEPARVVVHPKDTWVEEGGKAVLSCRASGDKPITYKWYKNKVIVESSEKVTADGPDLVLRDAIPADANVYFCQVSNHKGVDPHRSRTARIEIYTPDAVVELELTVDNPRHKESCQYFNMTTIEETVESLMKGEMAVVEFEKPAGLCNLTACSSDPCKNNGRCQTNGSDYVCLCPREWTGKQCQIDVDECTASPCSNGACENKRGSFFCNCRTAKSRSGKFCQLKNDVCKSSPCSGKEKCYPKDVVEGYECLNATKTVTMTYRLGETRTPFEEWMTHDIAKEIENAINDATIIQTKDGGRRRRAVAVDYSDCSVRISKHSKSGSDPELLDLDIILVCAQPPAQKHVCDAMFKKDVVASCTDEDGKREPQPKTDPPKINPERVTLAFIVRGQSGKDTEASETVSILKEADFEDKLKNYNIDDITLKARSLKKAESGESDSGLSSGAVTGVVIGCIVFILAGIVVALLTIRTSDRLKRRRNGGNRFSIRERAMLSRTQSTDAIVSRDIDLRELENAEARGVNNKTFSEIYENSNDLEDGAFMVDNPQLALKKQDTEYMKELNSSPWFHGSISRAKAEEMLDTTSNEGTFLVRSGLDMNEFYISVRTPNAEPKFRHISVHHRGENFVAVCGSEARNFTTFNELVEHLRANPTKMEGISEDVILTDHVTKA